VLASLLQRRRSTEANQTLHDVRPSPALVYYIYIFGGSCRLTEFCQLQNSLCVQVFRSPILAALLHDTPSVGVSQSLRHGTGNGITELSQRAPPISVRAAIPLGRGGFRLVQHVRPNRAPRKKGPHKRTGKFLQHINIPEIIEIIIRKRFCGARWRHKASSQVLPTGN